MIENVSTQLTVFHCFAHCLLPGRAFASLYVLLFLEKEAEIGGRENQLFKKNITDIPSKYHTERSWKGVPGIPYRFKYFEKYPISREEKWQISPKSKFGPRSGLTFCWAWVQTVCKGDQQTTIVNKELK